MNPLQQRYQYLSPPEVARQYVDDILAAASPDEVRLSAVCAAISALAVEGAH